MTIYFFLNINGRRRENGITPAERAHELDSTLLAAQQVKSLTSARPTERADRPPFSGVV
jgi:hypothetical protein